MAKKGHHRQQRRSIHYGYFFVAYVDVLGQRDKLMKLTELPHDESSRTEVMAILKETAGQVRKVRKAFRQFFNSASQRQLPPSAFAPRARREFERLRRRIDFSMTGFSDSFVIAVPLREREYGPVQAAMGVWTALLGVGYMSLAGLSMGIPLRAGIDVERATDVFRGEAYGPVLYRAYQLESQVAKYPRVVIGDGFRGYIDALKRNGIGVNHPSQLLAAQTAASSEQFICVDPDDGCHMLHVLAPQLLTLMELINVNIVSDAYQWVHGEREKFRNAGNGELGERYDRLVRYFERYGVQA